MNVEIVAERPLLNLASRMAYKYQPIKDEMFVSDDEAVSYPGLE